MKKKKNLNLIQNSGHSEIKHRQSVDQRESKMADKARILERRSVVQQQPITKWISVVETDGRTTQKKKHLVRFKQTRDVDFLKSDLTNTLKPTLGPVRHIYTPAGGTRVTSLDQLQVNTAHPKS